MAASAPFASNRNYHVRSSSMPSSRPHPVHETVEEKLSGLRQWESNLPSTSSSSSLCTGLSGLRELYNSLDDLLQLPQTQQALSGSTNKKSVEEVLDASLRLLDSCGTARDIMLHIADAVKDLQLALRRSSSVVTAAKTEVLEKGIGSYMALAKKMEQKASKCLKALMSKTQKSENSSDTVGSQSQLDEVMTVLREAMSIAINILEQLLSFVSGSKSMKMKRSSLVLKWIGSGRVSCEEKGEKMNDVERLHASLSVLCRKSDKDCEDLDQVKDAQEELNSFLDGIQGLEVGLDVLQRRLIQTRVSLLNILSH